MSRQSKNANNRARAKTVTAMHKNGEKGPAQTAPQHGKKWTYRHNPVLMKALSEFLKGPEEDKADKTSAKKILRKAGGASKAE